MIPASRRLRFMQDPVSIRLGGLAADLARIASFSENPKNADAVAGLFEEGKFFAEWVAPDADLEAQVVLVDVQRWLARRQRRWLAGQRDESMGQEAQRWSDRLLELSGLLSR